MPVGLTSRLVSRGPVLVTVAALLGGCDQGSVEQQSGREPVLLASSLDLHPPCSSTEDVPLACRRDVELHPLFVLRFDRPLSPSSASDANYRLNSGQITDVVLERVRVDPVERTVVIAINSALLPNTRYELRIEPAQRKEERIASFDGVPLTTPRTLVFWTKASADPDDIDTIEVEPVAANPCLAVRILHGCGARAGCHSSDPHEGQAAGLVLDTAAGIRGALNRMSTLVQTADDPAGSGDRATSAFPHGLPLVAPGSAAGSFLMYKLLLHASPDALDEAEAREPPHPTLAVPDPVVGPPLQHLAHVVSSRVPGRPMPPPDQGYPPLTVSELRTLRAWIDDGGRSCQDHR